MKPEEIRNLNWAEIRGRMTGMRKRVYDALLVNGPRTTKELESVLSASVLTIRPRVTELCQLGLAEVVEMRGHDGVYRAIPEVDAWRAHQAERARPEQLLMKGVS